jgi:hypothetical protein
MHHAPQTRRTTRRSGLLALAATTAAASGLALAPLAAGQTAIPAGVVCAPGTPAYGPSYGQGTTPPAYGIGTGAATGTGNPGAVRLTRAQLLINQRISQAAIRRTEAIQRWLQAGISARDICGGALGPEDFTGISASTNAPDVTRPVPNPRPLNIGRVGGGDPGGVTLSREQLLINQRISQAAVRRSNALRQRFLNGLTGGDLVNGTLTRGQLRVGFGITAVSSVPQPAASVTSVTGGPTGDPAAVRLSRNQLLINQRISQAAVRRSNAVIAHIRTGLNGTDFKNGSVTPADLATGVVG